MGGEKWKPAPHLQKINEALVDVAEGRIKRLIITMPPRHGKSEFTSKYFPCWYLGKYPENRLILASYGADFAMDWGRKARDILTQVGGTFFNIGIKSNSNAADRWEIETHGGGMRTTGVGGPLTGRGCNILIIDDPIKNAEEANSETYRAKTWDWYTSTAYTRLEPGGAVILIQTRWHSDDLAGRVLASQTDGSSDQWTVLNLPALAEPGDPLRRPEGEPLWPARYGVDDFSRIRTAIGGYYFSALYQQRPVPAEGGLFKRSWFKYYSKPDDEHYRLDDPARLVPVAHCRRFGTVDLAFSTKKEADYTVIAAWAATPQSDLILLDLIRERMEGPQLIPAMQRFSAQHGLDYIGIEDVSGQTLVIQDARMKGMTVRSLRADRDKVSRAIPATVRMEAGQVYFPKSHPLLADYESELMSFPRGAHDDMVDVTSYAALEVQRFGGAPKPKEEIDAETAEQRKRQEILHRDIDADHWWS